MKTSQHDRDDTADHDLDIKQDGLACKVAIINLYYPLIAKLCVMTTFASE